MFKDLSEAHAAYLANADYDIEGSVTKCQSFIVACRSLLVTLPNSSANQGTSTAFDVKLITEQKRQAESWLRANSSPSGRVAYASVEYYR